MAAKKISTKEKKLPKKRVSFALEAPVAQSVQVCGTFCNWKTDSHLMKKDKKGLWKTTLSLPPGRYEYRFYIDGEWRDDPSCSERVPNGFGGENCVLHVLREVMQDVASD